MFFVFLCEQDMPEFDTAAARQFPDLRRRFR